MSKTAIPESILTRAAQLAEAKNLIVTDTSETTEAEVTASRKKLFLKALVATVAVGAVTYLAVKLSGSDEEDDTETAPED